MQRRTLLGGMAALPMALAFARPSELLAQQPASRVIIDNDFAGDPDGLVALAHQLLSPKTRTVLVTSSALDPKLAGAAGLDVTRTVLAGAGLARELLDRMAPAVRPRIVAGAERFGVDQGANAAAQAIVVEALRDDPLPLVLTCAGPLTNVAAAIRLEPRIADRMKLMWIGGLAAPDGGTEYNLSTDQAAARTVLEQWALPVWRVPALRRRSPGPHVPCRPRSRSAPEIRRPVRPAAAACAAWPLADRLSRGPKDRFRYRFLPDSRRNSVRPIPCVD